MQMEEVYKEFNCKLSCFFLFIENEILHDENEVQENVDETGEREELANSQMEVQKGNDMEKG